MQSTQWFAALSVFLFACASSGKAGQQPSWRKATQIQSQGSDPSASEVLELTAVDQSASRYNDRGSVAVPATPLVSAILSRLSGVAAKLELPQPTADGRLCRALSELAAITPEDSPLPYSLVEFALHRNGIIEPSPHLVIIWGDEDHPEDIVAQLEDRLAGILQSGRFARVGIGTAPRGEGDIVILALQEIHIDLEPVQRELASEGKAVLEGRIPRSFREPHIYLTREDGTVDKLAFSTFDASGFRAILDCNGRKGKQQLEITAEDASGSTVLANFPVFCGTAAPGSLRIATNRIDRAAPASREEAEARMLELVNEDRAAHGLSPLAIDERLVGVARKHSQEMLDTGVVAHISPTTGSASDRVRAGDIKTAVVLENVARAYGVGEAEEGLMNSPGHRANILSRDATHLGIGIVLGEDVAGRRELLITQLFTRVPQPIDPARARSEVRQKILAARKMQSDAALDAVAQEFADDLINGETTQSASARAAQSLDKVATHFRRVGTLVTSVTDVASFDPKGSLGSESNRHYGLGIAQGDHPVMGEQAIYIVVLLAEK